MIIVRSPLRISLGGGGTDLPSYSDRFGGFLITAAIDKYVYITLHETFVPDLIIKYSKLERVDQVDDIEHPIIREALKLVGIEARYLELTSMADIPAGTGLGSSGSFTTALLKALHTFKKNLVHPAELAEQACDIELNLLLFFTGYARSASKILKEQDDKSKSADKSMIENLHFVKELGLKSQSALERGDLREFAGYMHLHWLRKKERSGGM